MHDLQEIVFFQFFLFSPNLKQLYLIGIRNVAPTWLAGKPIYSRGKECSYCNFSFIAIIRSVTIGRVKRLFKAVLQIRSPGSGSRKKTDPDSLSTKMSCKFI